MRKCKECECYYQSCAAFFSPEDKACGFFRSADSQKRLGELITIWAAILLALMLSGGFIYFMAIAWPK